ncbi:cystatin precursor [Corchorus olitorius]|uniref:Cystatin n=1 Tax=Corchorus olitorius TaxID=93759 RepID=A0A1R3FWT1_9ROSI|nr:cystatin precursor [Corchorus olitorius]
MSRDRRSVMNLVFFLVKGFGENEKGEESVFLSERVCCDGGVFRGKMGRGPRARGCCGEWRKSAEGICGDDSVWEVYGSRNCEEMIARFLRWRGCG